MKEHLQQYAAYNRWANQRFLELMNGLDESTLQQEVISSFPSLYHTVLHLFTAEHNWWQRLQLAEHILSPADHFKGTFQELAALLLDQSKRWEQWVAQANERQLEHVFAYQNLKGDHFKQPVWQMVLHLFNHGSYHRGQLVTLLRQAGVEKIPATDFIVFTRKK